jgi:hypothetical protein
MTLSAARAGLSGMALHPAKAMAAATRTFVKLLRVNMTAPSFLSGPFGRRYGDPIYTNEYNKKSPPAGIAASDASEDEDAAQRLAVRGRLRRDLTVRF